jgi:hypothetical protein
MTHYSTTINVDRYTLYSMVSAVVVFTMYCKRIAVILILCIVHV